MKTDGLILLAIDLALLAGVLMSLSRIHHRLDQIEKRLTGRARTNPQKKIPIKKD